MNYPYYKVEILDEKGHEVSAGIHPNMHLARVAALAVSKMSRFRGKCESRIYKVTGNCQKELVEESVG